MPRTYVNYIVTITSITWRVIMRWSNSEASLIFKSNLELAVSITLKQRELYESKYVTVEFKYLKIWDLLSFSICSPILVLK